MKISPALFPKARDRFFSTKNRENPGVFLDSAALLLHPAGIIIGDAVTEAAPAPHVPPQVSWPAGATQWRLMCHVSHQNVQQDLSCRAEQILRKRIVVELGGPHQNAVLVLLVISNGIALRVEFVQPYRRDLVERFDVIHGT